LPEGLATPLHHLFKVVDEEGRKVGILWINEQDRGGERIAYVYDIVIDAPHRRRGHAQAAFALMEDKAKELGLAGVALHVFGHNHEARALYGKLGFEPTNIQMFKRLP
jgi:ribosomal protein S18 acetylase RimI-like enzyme